MDRYLHSDNCYLALNAKHLAHAVSFTLILVTAINQVLIRFMDFTSC